MAPSSSPTAAPAARARREKPAREQLLREAAAAEAVGGLWSQAQAAAVVDVSVSYLRASDCPKALLPGHGAKGKPVVRYRPADVRAWVESCTARATEPQRKAG